jgi:hypothetical protein
MDVTGRKILRRLVLFGIACALATYAYWPALKAIGTLVYGQFHFQEQCDILGGHGGLPFKAIVVLSPIAVPNHLLVSTGCDTVDWIEEFRYAVPQPKGGTAVVLGSLLAALVISSLMVWLMAVLTGLALRRVRRSRSVRRELGTPP